MNIDHSHLVPLSDRFGVEVRDVDLAAVTLTNGYPEIRRLFEKHSLLLFRNQTMSDADHLRLGRMFGPLEDRKADERQPGEELTVSHVSNIKDDGGLTGEVDMHTLHLKANLLWHIDSTFLPAPSLTNILAARIVTTTGGNTEFASTRAAFADMPGDLRQKLRETTIWHHYAKSRARISPELAKLPMFNKWPQQHWKAVIANPVTKEEAIYIASHSYKINDLGEEESAPFLDHVMGMCTQPQYVYAHSWRVGDVLIWDQRATLHRGTPWPVDQPRKLSSVCVTLTEADGLEAMRA